MKPVWNGPAGTKVTAVPDGTLMDWVDGFTTFLGLGQEVAAFFTGEDIESELANLFASLLTEIQQVFDQDLTDAAAATAAGVAQTAQDFLAINYVNAQQAGESEAQLWTLLSTDSSGPSLQALSAQASTMTTWAHDNPTSMAQQTVSLALTIYSLIAALRRERARRAPDQHTRIAETANMRAYAALAATRIQPLLDSVSQARLAAISPITEGGFSNTDHGGIIYNAHWLVVTDSWNPGNASKASNQVLAVFYWGYGTPPYTPSWTTDTIPDMQSQITAARELYVKLAAGGNDSDMALWEQQLTNMVTTGTVDGSPQAGWINYFQFNQGDASKDGAPATPSAPGLQTVLQSVAAMGSWLYQGQSTLQTFTGLSLNGVACAYGPSFGGSTATLARFPIGRDGQLSPGTPTAPLQAGNTSISSVVFSPDRKYAYLALVNRMFNVPTTQISLCQYAITADRTLSPTPVSQVVLPESPGLNAAHVALSPDCRNAYVAVSYSPDYGPNAVYQYSVAADGSLSPKTPPSVTTPTPGAITLSADGKHLYVTNLTDNTVTHFPIAPDGTLSAGSATTVPVGPNGSPAYIVLSPDGKSAYVGNNADPGTRGSVSQYSVAGDGTLSPMAPASIATDTDENQIALRRDGLSAYVVAGNNTVLQYSIAADGTLSPKNPPSVTTGLHPSAIALSDDGQYAYVTDYMGTVSQYSIASDGTLSPMTPATVAPVPPPPQGGNVGYAASIAILPPTI